MEKNTIQKAVTEYYLLKLQNENLISNKDAVEIKKVITRYTEKSKMKGGKNHEGN